MAKTGKAGNTLVLYTALPPQGKLIGDWRSLEKWHWRSAQDARATRKLSQYT
jgi:hypothetical protein